MLKADGLDEAIIGEANIWRDNTQETVLVYSCDKIAEIIAYRDGMSEQEAIEFIEYNIEGAYMGKDTPVWYGTQHIRNKVSKHSLTTAFGRFFFAYF